MHFLGLERKSMYKYDDYDHQMVKERVSQYRDQTERFLSGDLPADEFQQLRLRNGLYVQRLAPMLRVAIPYGMVSSTQLRKLAHIARHYDKGYAHFTTRQNIQYNWPKLEEVPDILAELAEVEMHAIQTSGNCIRNTTSDQFAGVTPDEIEDSRPYAELIRQWSTFHPEFNWLPRKFKIAISGAEQDRAAVQVHDIGIRLVKQQGETGFCIHAGGGLGRTPVIGPVIRDYLPKKHLLTYLEAILRVYNRYGRRDNKYKARIKILVRAMTSEVFAEKVEAEWQLLKDGPDTLTDLEINRAKTFFTAPVYEALEDEIPDIDNLITDTSGFTHWLKNNVAAHKQPGYTIVTVALKATGVPPGDVSDKQMETLADLADEYSGAELRVTHEQNITLADVRKRDLPALYEKLSMSGMATANLGLLTDIICCPGGDYCSLANAKSIPVAEAIQRDFSSQEELESLGKLDINISGCMNACGHHHVGSIGILGVDKKGEEWYQVSLGGSADNESQLAQILGPSFARDDIPSIVRKITSLYLAERQPAESFASTFRRIGLQPFKDVVYATQQ